jgi:hypothetical protein
VRRDPLPTPLQDAQAALRDVLLDARDELDEREFRVFVDYVCRLVAREAARCTNWERRHGEGGAA